MVTNLMRNLKYVITNIPIYLILITIESCEISIGQENFAKFSAHFPKTAFPTIISDSLEFNSWSPGNLIDTAYVKQFGLINQYLLDEYHFNELKDYQCSYWGKFERDSLVVLIYKTFTTEAGRGNPELILNTYSHNGLKKDALPVLWNEPEDPLYSKRIRLSILSADNFEIFTIKTVNGYLNGKIVPKSIDQSVKEYLIQADGKIKLKKEKSNSLFLNKDPAILDDFPSH
jgi:hypothetical protein